MERSVETFIQNAKSLKVFVRQFKLDEKEYKEDKERREKLTVEIQTKETDLKKNCEIVYSALFECLLHLKVLRAHIECVLRWGVPPKYFISAIKVLNLLQFY